MTISEQLAVFIQENVSPIETDSIGPDDDLVEAGLIDSLGIVKLIAYICEEFGVEITDDDVQLENFTTVRNIEAMISRKRD